MKTDSKEFKAWLQRGSNDAWNNELTTANESYLETEDMMGRLPVTKETTVENLVGAEQLELMNRLGQVNYDPNCTLESLKQVDLDTRLSFPHELFVAIDKA